ncbi:MAG: hypothetical protein E6Q68_06675 [Polynucleobacter sp.]|nr:MAG: hypothetical protein E6Q68_06675 [Polynucleobacter sp.]
MSEDICQRLLGELPNPEGVTEMTQHIQAGIESGIDIWHLLIDNPLVLGMLLGGISVSYLRSFVLKKMKRVLASSQR